MAISDVESPITYFANPYLRCAQAGCGRRAVGMVGAVQVVSVANVMNVELPASGRNWPCYHKAGRTSVCNNWTSTTGCQHSTIERAAHSDVLTFEGDRK